MKPAPFDYVAPSSIEEACRLLSEASGGATLLAGGQTLMPLLNLRMSQPFILIDLKNIESLQGIRESGDEICLGPMTRQCELVESDLLARELPVLARAAGHVGHHQTRNRGTLGGSLALGEPAAELPATAVALGANFEIQSVRGSRRLAAEEFYLGPYMTALEPDELLTGIRFPRWPRQHISLFHELARRSGDFALVGMVGALTLEQGTVARAGLAWFGMGPTPMRASNAEQQLVGQEIGRIDAEAIAETAVAETAPFDDHHASAEYRRTPAPVRPRGKHWRDKPQD